MAVYTVHKLVHTVTIDVINKLLWCTQYAYNIIMCTRVCVRALYVYSSYCPSVDQKQQLVTNTHSGPEWERWSNGRVCVFEFDRFLGPGDGPQMTSAIIIIIVIVEYCIRRVHYYYCYRCCCCYSARNWLIIILSGLVRPSCFRHANIELSSVDRVVRVSPHMCVYIIHIIYPLYGNNDNNNSNSNSWKGLFLFSPFNRSGNYVMKITHGK